MNREYLDNVDALPMPWVQSPFFGALMFRNMEHMPREAVPLAWDFFTNGYITFNLELEDSYIDTVRQKIDEHIQSGDMVTQDERYHYNESPRIFDAWKSIPEVKILSTHPYIIQVLEFLYRRRPIPFQTINFVKGSAQPLHADVIHFQTIPQGWVAGAWIALEDATPNNGPLIVVPGSHHLPFFDLQYLGLKVPEFGKQFAVYNEYERFIDAVAVNMQKEEAYIKKGQVLIWNGNLIHGGVPIKDENSTRYSQATHYYFEGCERYYCPLLSNPYKGQYAEKDLTNKDISQHD
jgi:hypothetical protein